MNHMWNIREEGAYMYFRREHLIETIGHSIKIFRLSEDDAARLNAKLGFVATSGREHGHRLLTRRFTADVHLRQIVLADRPEVDFGLEPSLCEQLRQVGPELGEDGIAPVAAGMTDAREFDRKSTRRRSTVERAVVCFVPGSTGTVKTCRPPGASTR